MIIGYGSVCYQGMVVKACTGVSGELLIMVAAIATCFFTCLLASPCGVENEKITWCKGYVFTN